MSIAKRLYLIGNPTQYLNAVEHAFREEDADNHMVIISPFLKGFELLDEMGAAKYWRETRFLDVQPYIGGKNGRLYWKDGWQFLNSSLNDFSPDELVVGNITDALFYPFVLNEKRRFQSITVLDDGTPTLGMAAKRRNGGFFRAYNLRSVAMMARYLLYLKTLALFRLPPKELTFFTQFDVPFGRKDRVVKNEFSWLKKKVVEQEKANEALFIGTNIVDKRLVDEKTYLRSLEVIQNDLQLMGLQMVYCHHRSESEKMRNVIKRLYKTVDFDLPLEIVFLDRPRPTMVVGHFSSALFSLSRIYSNLDVRAYLFPDECIYGSEFETKDYLLLVQQCLAADSQIETFELTTV